jgi:hypothetical protein
MKPARVTRVCCEYEGGLYSVKVDTSMFFEAVELTLAAEFDTDEIDAATNSGDKFKFQIKTKHGWKNLEDVPLKTKYHKRVRMRAYRKGPDYQSEEMEDLHETPYLIMEDLAHQAILERKIFKKGQVMTAEEARTWLTQQSIDYPHVRTFLLRHPGGWDHLVRSLQYAFTFIPCFDAIEKACKTSCWK